MMLSDQIDLCQQKKEVSKAQQGDLTLNLTPQCLDDDHDTIKLSPFALLDTTYA